MRPFTISIDQEKLDSIRQRIEAYSWFPAPQNESGFIYGMSTPVLRELQDYWLNSYDWRAMEADLNKYPHFKATIEDHSIHFVHVIGEAGGKRPLLLTHGWPGSFYEFWQAIGPLAFPSQYGGKAEDAFDLVIPSLPGYGFSSKPASPIGPRATAALWDQLMRDTLGYETYLAQGGDWGAMVTSWIGFHHGLHNGQGGARAIHLNMLGFRPTPATPQTEEEGKWLQSQLGMMQAEGAYFMTQTTKPQTLSMALMDSPMGTAAWILEKFNSWSDTSTQPMIGVYSKDQLLTNVMLYLVNDAIATSIWFYNGFMQEGGPALPEGQRCETPTAFCEFPAEAFVPPPPSWIQRGYNLARHTKAVKGGHFAAMEVPDLYVKEVRDWARLYRV